MVSVLQASSCQIYTHSPRPAKQHHQLFSKTVSDSNNVLHTLLPPLSTASQDYNLRRRTHTYSLPGHDSYLCDCNFITRMLYKDPKLLSLVFTVSLPFVLLT